MNGIYFVWKWGLCRWNYTVGPQMRSSDLGEWCPHKKRGHRLRGRTPQEDGNRDWGDAPTSEGGHGLPEAAGSCRKPQATHRTAPPTPPPESLEGTNPANLELGFPASRTGRDYSSVCHATLFVVLCYGSPRKHTDSKPQLPGGLRTSSCQHLSPPDPR